jgi:uncharacterized membrane protein YfcA
LAIPRRRRRKLNIPLIKAFVMFVTGSIIALGTGLTGIAGQIAATPTIEFLLGLSPAKSAATALLGASLAHVPIDLGSAVVLTIATALGVALASGAARSPRVLKARRLSQSVVMLLMVIVIREAMSQPIGGHSGLALNAVHTGWGLAALGVGCGAVATLLHISSGVLLIPVLVFGVGRRMEEAATIALMVGVLASVLPISSYATQGLVDRGSSVWMMFGGIIGGLLGGYLLGAMGLAGSPVPLVLFALVAMFFSAWLVWKML